MDEFTTISTSWRHRELESLHKRLGKTDKDRAKERIKIKRKEAAPLVIAQKAVMEEFISIFRD